VYFNTLLSDNSAMRLPLRPTLLAVLLLGLAACALNPVSGERELALLTEAEEIKLGRDNDAEIRKQYGVYPDRRLQAQVQQVGERLAAKSHRPQLQYTFTVLDSPEVNAFALPGGYIYITRGILAHLNSEAELAAVLGHEIGHVTARHAVRQYSAAVAANVGFTLGSIFLPDLATRAGQSLFNVLGGALLSGYGREHELEADRLGAEYLARSAYDPQAMIEVVGLLKNQEVFEKQLAAKEGRQPRVYHGVFASHPSADQRLQQVVAAADPQRVRNGRVERAAYLQMLDGLAWGDSEAQGIRRGADFYHAGLNFALRFPEGWRVDNAPDKLLAVSPGGDALVQVQATARGAVRTPQEYLVVTLKLTDLRETRALKVNGLPAYAGVARLQTPFGARDARVAVVFLHDQAFRFFGAARDAQGRANAGVAQDARLTPAAGALERDFLASVQSLHALRPAERALARGLRLKLVTARAGDRYATLARRTPLQHEPQAILRLINGQYPEGEPATGALVKIIQ
jgi:predicted Zn-dependent protease